MYSLDDSLFLGGVNLEISLAVCVLTRGGGDEGKPTAAMDLSGIAVRVQRLISIFNCFDT